MMKTTQSLRRKENVVCYTGKARARDRKWDDAGVALFIMVQKARAWDLSFLLWLSLFVRRRNNLHKPTVSHVKKDMTWIIRKVNFWKTRTIGFLCKGHKPWPLRAVKKVCAYWRKALRGGGGFVLPENKFLTFFFIPIPFSCAGVARKGVQVRDNSHWSHGEILSYKVWHTDYVPEM